jgi:hypothetical protein
MPHPADTAEGEVAPNALLRKAKHWGRRKDTPPLGGGDGEARGGPPPARGKPGGFPSEVTVTTVMLS